nr:hypothetical protein [uncultured Haemophilus sp.]
MADTPLKSGCFGLNDDALEVKKTAVYRVCVTPWQGVALWEYLLHLVDSFDICQHLSTFFNPHNFVLIQSPHFWGD